MLFSDHPRTHYRNAPAHEVICQLRFPAILTINNTEPADFQEAIRAEFPQYARRQDAAPAAAFWDGTPFPFTADFLSAISRAEAVAAVPPRDAYDVLLRSQPTILNREATQRPDSTEFYLQCTDAPQRLLNNNYPRSARIHYAPAQCAAAGIVLRFPDFEARYVYPDFIAFLRDFQYGERTFTPGDFPDAAQKLAAISANSLTVRLLPDKSAAILEAKDNEPATLPERIVYTW